MLDDSTFPPARRVRHRFLRPVVVGLVIGLVALTGTDADDEMVVVRSGDLPKVDNVSAGALAQRAVLRAFLEQHPKLDRVREELSGEISSRLGDHIRSPRVEQGSDLSPPHLHRLVAPSLRVGDGNERARHPSSHRPFSSRRQSRDPSRSRSRQERKGLFQDVI